MKRTILAAAILLVGCATGDSMGSLQEGMSPAEVTAILGAPTGQQRAGGVLRYEYSNRFIPWTSDRADYYATFQDGRLTQWGVAELRQGQQGTIMVLP